ncbi:hypothetical protein TWF696_006638 [Orbilia brochopaga]|uniref:Fe2OG dioxygenase domain-containing protein n=1 Tax=Orbilia brochopaga TaxID=3140254 RepID=A0AAV9UQY2_9PEZI
MAPPLDAHATAPPALRELYKHYSKLPADVLSTGPAAAQILDLGHNDADNTSSCSGLRVVDTISRDDLSAIYTDFLGHDIPPSELSDVKIYEHSSLPGLRVLPSLLPLQVQEALLSKLLLRDLSNPAHQTNIHLHYNIPPLPPPHPSFFHLPKPAAIYTPKDPDVHKPLTVADVLEKKLRWMTLGGQYNWTTKEYPDGPPVPFPKDIRDLVHALFPTVEPQAAICNTYSPGDTLSPHRDVSEEADRDLVSISIGCDALFLISLSPPESIEDTPSDIPRLSNTPSDAHTPKQKRRRKKTMEPPPPPPPFDEHTLILRVRSGDAIVMGGDSRWAWHGVPKVLADTCPDELSQWPSSTSYSILSNGPDISDWAGWMTRKRVNLNVRQMYDWHPSLV